MLIGAALAFGPGGARAEPLKIRQGWVSLTNVLSPLVFEKKDLLKHYGKSYVIEPTRFKGTSAELTAIAAGDVDIITLGYSTLGSAVENAHLDDLRVVADGFQDGIDDYLSSPYMVLNDSGIKTIEDLKGKVLAVNVVGGAVDLGLRAMLREHHMDGRKDVSIIEAAFPAMNAMLLEGKVDLIASVPPFTYDPKLRSKAHVLFTLKDAMGPTQMIILAAREEFMQKNRAAVTDYFEDMLRASKWFLDPANREEAIKITAESTKQPAQRYASYLFTKKDYYHTPSGVPNLASLQHAIETQRKLGFLKSDIDVKKYADLGANEEAAKRLK
jgi:NitT/TauT family transport system substrate-binding protein